MHKVTSVKPLGDHELELCFDKAEKRIFNVSPYMDRSIFAQLKDRAYCCQVRVFLDQVAWPNGQDSDPDYLYAECHS